MEVSIMNDIQFKKIKEHWQKVWRKESGRF